MAHFSPWSSARLSRHNSISSGVDSTAQQPVMWRAGASQPVEFGEAGIWDKDGNHIFELGFGESGDGRGG